MSEPVHKPKRLLLPCLSCGNECKHDVVGESSDDFYDDSGWIGSTEYVLVKCSTCDTSALHTVEEDYNHCVWPHNAYLGSSVPKSVQDQYSKALQIRRRDASMFAVRIRRALEAMCTERGRTEKLLFARLKGLSKDFGFPGIASDMADMARMLGNKGAHDLGEVTRDEADALHDFFLALIEYVYVGPAKLRKYEIQLKKLTAIP